MYRVIYLIGFVCERLLLSPFYLLGQILVLPVLAFAWIKSVLIGFARLADFVCSGGKDKKILASNRLDEIGQVKLRAEILHGDEFNSKLPLDILEQISRKYKIADYSFRGLYDGTSVETRSKAIFGYTFGIYDFDVKRSSSSKPEAPKIEAQFRGEELYRMQGRKWM